MGDDLKGASTTIVIGEKPGFYPASFLELNCHDKTASQKRHYDVFPPEHFVIL
jgi:hypothetical protein